MEQRLDLGLFWWLERIGWGVRGAAGLVAVFWMDLGAVTQWLLIMMAADMATGILAAYITKTVSSDASFRGLAKKAIVLILIATLGNLDGQLGLGTGLAGLYIAHEAISIVENAVRAGVWVPPGVREALLRYQELKQQTFGQARP